MKITRTCILILFTVIFFSVPVSNYAQKGKIVFFGSSVANGSGDTTGAGGYAGIIAENLIKQGWTVLNLSKGGDNTTKILPRFEVQLLPEKPDFVIIGLSLGNEGIAAAAELNRNRNFEKYRNGMLHLVQLCSDNGMYPVVVNCYARDDFGEEQYQAVKKMNLIINTWDVPSINVLGTIDNGKGNWLDGIAHDRSHPNYKGHLEMAYAFVPGLFEAIKEGKPVPYKIRNKEFLSIEQPSSLSPLSFIPVDSIHSYSICFVMKSAGTGTFAALKSGDARAFFKVGEGKISFQSMNGKLVSADTTGENDGWQYVVLAHQYASGKTTIYFNGVKQDNIFEPLNIDEFILGGSGIPENPAPGLAGYKDLLIYRSALNEDEVRALYYDQLLQSSLEVYAPLNDPEFISGTCADNYAQSQSKLKISGNYKSVKQK